jgi:hypothetical protein
VHDEYWLLDRRQVRRAKRQIILSVEHGLQRAEQPTPVILPVRRVVELPHLLAPGWIGLEFGHAPPEVRAVVGVPGETSADQREGAYAVQVFTTNEQQGHRASYVL